jgi:hypothetical protein
MKVHVSGLVDNIRRQIRVVQMEETLMEEQFPSGLSHVHAQCEFGPSITKIRNSLRASLLLRLVSFSIICMRTWTPFIVK